MRKRLALVICSVILLAMAGCHFHRHAHRPGNPHGMPPGQAKKVVKPDITPLKVKRTKHKRLAKPWK